MKKMNEYAFHIGLELQIYPSDLQKKIIVMNGGASRFIYNRLVAVNREMFTLRKTAPFCPSDQARLNYLESLYSSSSGILNAVPFLKQTEIDSDMTANAILNYKNAWKRFKTVSGTSMPSFHKKDNSYSYKTSNHYGKNRSDGLRDGSIRFLDDRHIILPKIGRIRFKGSKKLITKLLSRKDIRIGSVKLCMDQTGRCSVSLALGSDTPFHDPYPLTHTAVGIDMNLSNFLTDSDGNVTETQHCLKKSEKQLIKAQKSLSRKQKSALKEKRDFKDSRRYQKQRLKAARIHKHIANQRKDFHLKEADRIVKSHDFIFAEDLKARNLIKNHHLAKAIADSGWRQFLTYLQQTASKRGKICLLINSAYTTQKCSSCGYISHGDSRIVLGQEDWICPECGTYHIRDHNAALNIRDEGLSVYCRALSLAGTVSNAALNIRSAGLSLLKENGLTVAVNP